MTECTQEFEFVLTLHASIDDYDRLENALFEAGCDDATLSLRFGRLFLAFCREATSYEEAVVSAIANVTKAGAIVDQIDDCNLVTQAEIARRAGRSRQVINQYITGKRGPGKFPAPDCQIAEGAPLWLWCEVSIWLFQNGFIKESDARKAQVVWTVNMALWQARRKRRKPSDDPEYDERLAARIYQTVDAH